MGKVTSTIAKINPFPQTDIFREPPLRFLGYANEIGEAFRIAMPKLFTPSYIISFAYVFDMGQKQIAMPKLFTPSYIISFAYVFDMGQKQYFNDNQK
eukprot:gene24578-10190_t